MALMRCPICDKTFEADQSLARPFCSARCRSIDLGRWLEEHYGLPFEPEEKPPDPDAADDSG